MQASDTNQRPILNLTVLSTLNTVFFGIWIFGHKTFLNLTLYKCPAMQDWESDLDIFKSFISYWYSHQLLDFPKCVFNKDVCFCNFSKYAFVMIDIITISVSKWWMTIIFSKTRYSVTQWIPVSGLKLSKELVCRVKEISLSFGATS